MTYRLKYNKYLCFRFSGIYMKSTDNKASVRFLYFIKLSTRGNTKIHIVIRKITLTIHIV